MARTVTNVNVTTDTFETWVNKTNDLLLALSTEIITANDATANTGTTAEPRRAQLYGRFGANTLVATDNLRGGNVGDLSYGLLTISSNTTIGGNSSIGIAQTFISYANVLFENANTQVNAQIITVTGNSFIKGNTSVVAINVLGNSSITNTIVNGTDLFVRTTYTSVNSISVFTGNTSVKANSTITLLEMKGNGTTANTIMNGNLVQITANLDVTGSLHTIAGNVIFDTQTMFVDSFNNSVGIGTVTPDANLNVIGTANVSGAVRLANTLAVTNTATFANNVTITGTLGVTRAATFSNTLGVTGAVTFSNTLATTGAVTFSNTLATTGAATFSNTISVTGAATFSNTLGVTGAASFSNTLAVTGNIIGNVTLSNALTVIGNATFLETVSLNNFIFTSLANGNLGTEVTQPLTIFSFNKNQFSTAKITSQIKTLSGNTMASELVLAHNTTDAYITVYATVVSPLTADPGDYSVDISGNDVQLKFKQNSISSASKVIATLIK